LEKPHLNIIKHLCGPHHQLLYGEGHSCPGRIEGIHGEIAWFICGIYHKGQIGLSYFAFVRGSYDTVDPDDSHMLLHIVFPIRLKGRVRLKVKNSVFTNINNLWLTTQR
jgi:hypothetical protein